VTQGGTLFIDSGDEGSHAANRGNVIIVDDDGIIRESIALSLSGYDFDVRTYASGAAFLDGFDPGFPACIVLDIVMPDMDGFAVLRALADRRAWQPVIVLSGQGAVRHAVEAMQLGALDVFEKPCEIDVLAKAIDRHLASLPGNQAAVTQIDDARTLIDKLSPREAEVLALVRDGKANKQIAFDMGLSVRTVEMHRRNLMQKLGARALPDALRIAQHADMGTPRFANS
jgi:two-component system response regulator FixJ